MGGLHFYPMFKLDCLMQILIFFLAGGGRGEFVISPICIVCAFLSLPLHGGSNIVKLFTAVIDKCLGQARVLVPGKPFQPSLMFAGPYRSESPLDAPLLGRLLALSTNIRLGWKGLPGKNSIIRKIWV